MYNYFYLQDSFAGKKSGSTTILGCGGRAGPPGRSATETFDARNIYGFTLIVNNLLWIIDFSCLSGVDTLQYAYQKIACMIDEQTVRQVAELARLSLTDEEVTMYATDLQSVFSYIDQLQEIPDLDDHTPVTTQVTGLQNVVREDDVVVPKGETIAALKDQFPDRVGDLLKVQAVFTDTDE